MRAMGDFWERKGEQAERGVKAAAAPPPPTSSPLPHTVCFFWFLPRTTICNWSCLMMMRYQYYLLHVC
jgi:hypothetical protein